MARKLCTSFLYSLKFIVKEKLDSTTSRKAILTEIPVHDIIQKRDIGGWFQLKRYSENVDDGTASIDSKSSGGWISLQVSYKPKHELPYPNGNEYKFILKCLAN